jgi:integrase
MKTNQELIEIFEKAKYSLKTVRTYAQQLLYLQDLLGDLDKVNLSDIKNMISNLRGVKPIRSIKLSVSALKTFYNLTKDPLAKEINLERLGIFVNEIKKEYVSPERLEEIIIKERPDYGNSLEVRDYTAFLTFANTGAKLNEVCKLKFDDYHINAERPFIKIGGGQKNQRDIPIDNFFLVYLHCVFPFWNEALAQHGIEKPEFVFTSMYSKEPVHSRMMEKIIIKYGVTAREIRNSFLAKLQRNKTNPKIISRLMGISEYNAIRPYRFTEKFDR